MNAVTIRNDIPKLDHQGKRIDSHSGHILEHNGMYFLYGEMYGNTTGMVHDWSPFPKLGVYTSNDLLTWEFRGQMLPSVSATGWVPWVIYDKKMSRFVCWYGQGNWNVATSTDGINFEIQSHHITSRLGGKTDGNNIFIDDDGQGYIIFSAPDIGHLVSIEKLTPDYLNTTKVNVTGFFPDNFVECPILFKRGKIYYVTYGNCCCACRQGAGLVVFTAPAVTGPWSRQKTHPDINCPRADVDICRGDAFTTGNFTIPAQGYTVSQIQTQKGTSFLWMGNRWLSGPHNNPECKNLCKGPACKQPGYFVGQDDIYWAPLHFDQHSGSILPLQFVNEFSLDL